VDLHTIELCAGYSGIGLGLRLAHPGTRTVCYVENEVTACETLASRFADGSLDVAPVWTDLRTFDGRPWRQKVHLIAAGYPCQPFSVAGKRKGAKDPRHLWPEVARIVREVEPLGVFLENVDGHFRLGFEQVCKELDRMGYRVAAGSFSAAEVGASHLRKRLFALAVMDNSDGRHFAAQLQVCAGGNASNAAGGAERHGSARQDGGRRRRVREAGNAVEDAHHVDRRQRVAKLETVSQIGRREPAVAGRGVADAGVGRPSLVGDRQGGEAQRAAALRIDRCFPPGPEDLEAWREVLAVYPEAQPNFCRVVDGSAARVDRLRTLGNGVVPLVAAFAFRTLADALEPAERTEALAA
jgi:DNA (cytosine-5)-methyltransferase 1